MTASNGSVGMKVQVPVLGTVVGTRTLREIAAGTPPKPPVEAPAVTVRDLSASGLAALKAASTPTVPKTGGLATAPPAGSGQTPRPARPAAPPKTVDKEAEANKLFQLAENYLRANMKSMAIGKLEAIVKKYPGTKTAEKAQAKLEALGA